MTKNVFIKHLKSLETGIPEGHARRNKGVTTYFYPLDKHEEVSQLLCDEGLADQGQHPMYVKGFHTWNGPGKRVTTCTDEAGFVAISISNWPT